MIILCSHRDQIRDHWKDALVQHINILETDSLEKLRTMIRVGRVDLILLHLATPGIKPELPDLGVRSPINQFKVFTLSDKPNEKEGLRLLKHGIRGYANTYITPQLLQKAVTTILNDEVWVGRHLMQQLIHELTAVKNESLTQERLCDLTSREMEIAQLIGKGESNKRIAQILDISDRTVKVHLHSIFQKTEVKDRLQLALLVNGH